MKPSVSLIMTSHNSQAYLARAMKSVINQSWTEWQLILVDDGSTDATLSTARRLAARDARITVHSQSHLGRVPALTTAMTAASAPLIGWLDSDDELHPDALSETVAFLKKYERQDLVYTDYTVIDSGGREMGLGRRCRRAYSKHGLLRHFMTFHFRLFRRELLHRVAPILTWEPFAEDYDFCLRASEVALFGKISKPLYRYRKHRQQLSATHRLQQIQATQKVIQRALDRRGLADQLEVDLELRGIYHIRRK